MNSQEITELKKLLCYLKEIDSNFRVFGSEEHKYELRPTLTEGDLRAFEQKYQVKLPEDYKFFLREVGGGGAGPNYGLATLAESLQDRDLSKPFRLTKATEEMSKEEWRILKKLSALDRYGDVIANGILAICHEGCNGYANLVVNGFTYGRIWDEGEGSYIPTGLTFGAWYQQWVEMLQERALPTLKNERKAEKVKIGMPKQEVIAVLGEQWRDADVLGTPTLIFENLATQFELDNAKKVVTRIINYSIC